MFHLKSSNKHRSRCVIETRRSNSEFTFKLKAKNCKSILFKLIEADLYDSSYVYYRPWNLKAKNYISVRIQTKRGKY